MTKLSLKVLATAGLLAITGSALGAGEDTAFFKIERLQGSSLSSDSYRVFPAAGYTLPTQGCTESDFAEVQVNGPTSDEKAKMSRMLLAAFMSDRKVQLRLDGCGLNGRPAYRIVRMQDL